MERHIVRLADSYDLSVLFPATLHTFLFAPLRGRKTRHSFPAARFLSRRGRYIYISIARVSTKRRLRGDIWSKRHPSLRRDVGTLYSRRKRALIYMLSSGRTRANFVRNCEKRKSVASIYIVAVRWKDSILLSSRVKVIACN